MSTDNSVLRRVNGFLKRIPVPAPLPVVDITARLPDLDVAIPSGRFYVYVIRDESNAVLYIGKGQGTRAFDWRRFSGFKTGSLYRVTLYYMASEAEAFKAEVAAIRKLRPRLNVQYNVSATDRPEE